MVGSNLWVQLESGRDHWGLLEFVLRAGATCLSILIHRLPCSGVFTSLRTFFHFAWASENILMLSKLKKPSCEDAYCLEVEWKWWLCISLELVRCAQACMPTRTHTDTHTPQKSWRMCNGNAQNQNIKLSKYQDEDVVILVHIYKDVY